MYTNILAYRSIYSFVNMKVKPNRALPVTFKKWQIVKGDTVKVRSGSDKGKIGKVIKVFRKMNAVIVAGVNLRLRRFKTQDQGKVEKRKPSRIHVSNVGLYDPSVKKAVRIRYGFHPETNEKLRISKKSGRVLKKPKNKSTHESRGKKRGAGTKDTTYELAHKVTYEGEDFEKIKKQFEEFIAEKQQREKKLVFLI